MEGLFAGLIFITVALTALAIGLLTSTRAIRESVLNVAFLKIVGVNVAIVPLAAWVVVSLLPVSGGVSTGVLLCAICAAGPIALKASQVARADLSWALSLTVVLLTANVATLPLWSGALIGEALSLQAADLLGVLVGAIMVPVSVGIVLRRLAANVAVRLSDWVTQLSNLTLVGAVAVGIVENIEELAGFLSLFAVLAAILVMLVAAVAGWSIPGQVARRRAASLTTLNRASSVALLVVGRVFSEGAEVFTTVVVFGLVQTVAALALSLYWRRTGARVTVAV